MDEIENIAKDSNENLDLDNDLSLENSNLKNIASIDNDSFDDRSETSLGSHSDTDVLSSISKLSLHIGQSRITLRLQLLMNCSLYLVVNFHVPICQNVPKPF